MGLLYGLLATGRKMDTETLETYLDSFEKAIQFAMKTMNVMDHNDTQRKHGWFDEHKLMGDDDDDIDDLEDYLIRKDPPYYVNKEEERSKERRCKLHGIPYVKPPICKSEKFEVVKYSFGPAEEYVAIKEYEYDIWF
ncbi:hypothetical protein Tco_0413660 [Tanacetum coccineum]